MKHFINAPKISYDSLWLIVEHQSDGIMEEMSILCGDARWEISLITMIHITGIVSTLTSSPVCHNILIFSSVNDNDNEYVSRLIVL